MDQLKKLLKMNRSIHAFFLILIATICIGSEWNYFKEHGKLNLGREETPLFVDENGESQALLPSVTEMSEGQFYFWLLVGGVVVGMVVWKCEFETESGGE